jgi:hypothetical protein
VPPTVAAQHADDHGRYPPTGETVAVLRDTKPAVATIDATTSTGKAVTFRFPVAAAHR